jgi:Spy/CpxP family protein refolding chaperone
MGISCPLFPDCSIPKENKMSVLQKCAFLCLMAPLAVLLCVSDAAAQPGGRGGPGGGFGGPGGGGLTGVLMREEVQKELEMLGDQVDDIRKLLEDRRGGMREMFSGLRDIEDRDERMEKARELMQKAQADLEKEVGKILLPHQMERAKQLAYQQRLRGGAGRALTGGGPLAEELGITEAQQEKLRAKNEELQDELRQKIAELQKEAQEKLLKVLTPQQQAKFKELVGEPFQFQQMQFGGRFGRGEGGNRPAFGQGQGRGQGRGEGRTRQRPASE